MSNRHRLPITVIAFIQINLMFPQPYSYIVTFVPSSLFIVDVSLPIFRWDLSDRPRTLITSIVLVTFLDLSLGSRSPNPSR